MLLLARDENGEPMSDAELRDELMTLLLAGHETTASTLSWAFEYHQCFPAPEPRKSAARSPPTVPPGSCSPYGLPTPRGSR